MLENCLLSLEAAKKPANLHIKVAVFDNDPESSAKTVVESVQEKTAHDIDYIKVQQRGIPIARNAALDYAGLKGFDGLIFIDDDETVAPDWLLYLTDYARLQKNQAVIHGRVISRCPAERSSHLTPFFTQKKTKPTGTKLISCSTDNVFIPMNIIISKGLRFDETHPLAGGTDSLFFDQAHKAGVEIFSCAEALAIEHIPEERMSVRWLSKRKFRAGTTVGQRKACGARSIIQQLFSDLLKVIYNLILSMFFLVFFLKTKSIKHWLKVCRSTGSACGMVGIRVNAYAKTDGY